MKNILIENVSLAIPSNWITSEENEMSYWGESGLLDIRISPLEKPLGVENLIQAKENLNQYDPNVELVTIGGFRGMKCFYKQDGNSVHIYSIQTDLSHELRAVYVFRPGYIELENEIKNHF